MKKWIILGIIICIVIAANLFPIYRLNDIDNEDVNQSLSYVSNEINQQRFKAYDYKNLEDNRTLVSYHNDNLKCYLINEPCGDWYENARSLVVMYDENKQPLWTLGGNDFDEPSIVFSNEHITIHAVDELSDKTVVAFGRSVNLSTKILRDILLFIDEDGNPYEIQYLNLLNYTFNKLSYYITLDVVNTGNQGFTIKLSDATQGSIVIHFNEDKEEEWHVIIRDILGPESLESFYETLYFTDGFHYVMSNGNLYTYDLNGDLLWHKIFVETPTSFYVNEDQEVFISGMFRRKISYLKNPFDLGQTSITYLTSYKISGFSGNVLWKNRYGYESTEKHRFYGRYIWEDDLKNRYQLVESNILDDAYQVLLLKWNAKGKFVGSDVFAGDYSYDDSTIIRQFDKKEILSDDDHLFISSPILSKRATIDLNEVAFDDSMPISYSAEAVGFVMTFRMIFNRLVVASIIVVTTFILAKLYFRKEKPIDYTE